MQVQLAALAYALFAIFLGYAGSRAFPPIGERERFFVVWVLITVLLFLSTNPFVFLSLSAVILFAAKPSNRSHYLVFYIFALHMVPIKVGAPIPFPGLNYLISMDVPKLATIVLLLPLLLRTPNKLAADYRNTRLDQLVILYFVLMVALGIRNLPLTSIVRSSVDFGLIMLVPYFAARNSITSVGDLHRFIRYWIVVCIVLAVAGLITQYKYWNFYGSISSELFNEFSVIRGGSSFRAGDLRSAVMLNPTTLGYALSIGVVFAQFLKKQSGNKIIRLRLVQILFLLAIYTTHSRGAWFALLVMAMLYIDLFSRFSAKRALRRTALAVGGMIVVFTLQISSFLALDKFGTFEYRYQLIINSWQLIKQYPLFGLAEFRESSVLEASRQGQGIVDMTNTYLAVALRSGIVGTVMFILIFALPIISLWKSAGRLSSIQMTAESDICRVMIVVLAGLALLLGTISWIGLLPHYTFLLVGIAAGVAGLARAALAGTQKRRSPAGGMEIDVK